MPWARCIRGAVNHRVGEVLEIGSIDHPFITSGDFELCDEPVGRTHYVEMIEPEPIKSKVIKPKLSKVKKGRRN
ncbi:MAG: hypothetical protein EHM49_01070 [Deltaproteobacteria bacterium]|nr:MAG: hypothetical protein EHM49_01070 [Deltaproteobacteria bacterium]